MMQRVNAVLLLVVIGLLLFGGSIADQWHEKNVAETAELHKQADALEARLKRAGQLLEWAARAYAEQQGGEVPELNK